MKLCPNCRLQAPLNATQCVQCGHAYRTQFQTQQTQVVPPVTPPAPQAPEPPKWWQWFVPGVGMKYQADMLRHQAEVGVYMSQNGLITPQMRRRATLMVTAVGVILIAFLLLSFYESFQFNRKMDAEIERSMREAAQTDAAMDRQLRESEAEFNRAVADYERGR